MNETPALQYLLEDDVRDRDAGGTPWGCSYCPFARAAATQRDEWFGLNRWAAPNPGDLDEGHYWCDLLKLPEPVWGESPKCQISDWRKRAREELRQIMTLAAVKEQAAP